jgi:hypothetical protein
MKPLYRIILFILICWFGYNAVRHTFEGYYAGLLALFQHFNLFVLIVLSVAALASDITSYRSYPKLFQFYSSLAGLFLCAVVFFRIISFNKIDTAVTLMTVSSKAGSPAVLEMEFKEKGYLRIKEFSRLGQDIYYGKYYQQHDSIVITETNYEKFAFKLPLAGHIDSGMVIWNGVDTMKL